ncbi:MAG: C40 family peptidase [Coprobacillus sp.]|nr:C40 family peptidase [Coprobacillus sp.]
MKFKKPLVFGTLSICPFFFILIIIIAAAGGGRANEHINGYSKNIDIYNETINYISNEYEGYNIRLNELAWYYILTGEEPTLEKTKNKAEWIAKNKADYQAIIKEYKKDPLYKEKLKDYSNDELVAYMSSLEVINNQDENNNLTIEGSEAGVVIANKALSRLGCTYVWGAAHSIKEMQNPNQMTFDCSGLVCWSLYQCGYKVQPMNTKILATQGKGVSKKALSLGDIILFSNDKSASGIHHVGIYIGDNKMVHAPRTGKPVQITSIKTSYYDKQFYCVRRLY